MKSIYRIAFAAGLLALGSCGEKKPPADATEEHTETPAGTGTAEEGTVTLSDVQLQAVGIEIGQVGQKNLTSVVRASGQLEVPPQNKAALNVLYGGIVRKITVLAGQNVRKGQTLVTLENTDVIKLQQDYLTAKRGFTFIAQEYDRQKALKAEDAGTGKSYQAAEANYRAEQARLSGMARQLQQVGIDPERVAAGAISREISVAAPISGTVSFISATTGTYAQPGTPLMEIVDNSKIHADITVYEKDLFKVRDGQSVRFMLTNQANREITGKIYGVNKSFEGDAKGIIVHAAINASGTGLIPGMYVTALIDVGEQLSPAVPVEAIVRAEGKDYIYLQTGSDGHQHRFRKLEVATGVSELGYTQITPLEALPADAAVVTKGAFYVRSKESGGGEEE